MRGRGAYRLRNVFRAFEFFVAEENIAVAVGKFDFAVRRNGPNVGSGGVAVSHFHAEGIVIRILCAVRRYDGAGIAQRFQPFFQRNDDFLRVDFLPLFRYIVFQREFVSYAAFQILVKRDRAQKRLINLCAVLVTGDSELRERQHRQNDEHYTDNDQ